MHFRLTPRRIETDIEVAQNCKSCVMMLKIEKNKY